MSDSFVTPWTVTQQAPLSTEFPRQDTGVGCHFLLNPGIEPILLHCKADSLPLRHQGSLNNNKMY